MVCGVSHGHFMAFVQFHNDLLDLSLFPTILWEIQRPARPPMWENSFIQVLRHGPGVPNHPQETCGIPNMMPPPIGRHSKTKISPRRHPRSPTGYWRLHQCCPVCSVKPPYARMQSSKQGFQQIHVRFKGPQFLGGLYLQDLHIRVSFCFKFPYNSFSRSPFLPLVYGLPLQIFYNGLTSKTPILVEGTNPWAHI